EGGGAAGVDVEVPGQLDLGRPAGEVFNAGVDQPAADAVARAAPPVRGGVGEDCGVVVLVLDPAGHRSGLDPPDLLHVELLAGVPVLAAGEQFVPAVV